MNSASTLATQRSPDRTTNPAGKAFDRIAARYDQDFTESLIGRLQREQVWRQLDGLFPAGGRILDLGCGTGADAMQLARQGFEVHAVDASEQMIAEMQRKITAAGLAERVTTQVAAMEKWDSQSCLSILSRSSQSSAGPPGKPGALSSDEDRQDCLSHLFEGAISNFGALNCVAELRPVAKALSQLVRPGRNLALCLISGFCLWETVSYSFQGRFARAARRWTNGGRATASLNGSEQFPVYYHQVREVCEAFEPEFRLTAQRGIGVFVPPTYLEARARRLPRLTRFAARVDQAVARWPGFRAMADHTLLVFQRGHKP